MHPRALHIPFPNPKVWLRDAEPSKSCRSLHFPIVQWHQGSLVPVYDVFELVVGDVYLHMVDVGARHGGNLGCVFS